MATYSYDAWGNPLSTPTGTIATLNPLRYRGYIWDAETELYYLQSRYYDPTIGRFINADNLITGVGSSILGNNLYAYCWDNPVNLADYSGHLPQWLEDLGDWFEENVVEPVEEFLNKAFSVKYDVPIYNQGRTSLCWAFCQVMVESFKSGQVLTNDQATAAAIKLSILINGSDWNCADAPTNRGNMTQVDSILGLFLLVRITGPIYALYRDIDDESGHYIVVTGVDVSRGLVYTNNPHGIRGQQSFEEFLNGFVGGPDDGSYPLRGVMTIR